MRHEFSKAVKRQAFERADGQCEGTGCNAPLQKGKYHYDHVDPDWFSGDDSLENCAVLCRACHKAKTTNQDVPNIARAKRIRDKDRGIRLKSTFPNARDGRFKTTWINGRQVTVDRRTGEPVRAKER